MKSSDSDTVSVPRKLTHGLLLGAAAQFSGVIMAHALPRELVVRAYRDDDKPYIASTFLHTSHDLALFSGTPDRLFHPPMQRLFDTILRHPRAVVAVVVDRDDSDTIRAWLLAWLLEATSVVWYSHTAARFRRRGICSHLIETLPGGNKASVFTSKIGHRINQKHRLVRYPTLMLEVLK